MSSISSIFQQFNISNNGFLPEKEPLQFLPEFYKEWDDLAYELPILNKENKTKERVAKLPLLTTDHLTTLEEIQRAYLVLCMISHSYIWSDLTDVPSILPKQIAVPWHTVSNMLGIKPVLTHAAVDLYNWKLIDNTKPLTVDNLRCIHTVTGEMDEEWFYLIMTDIEKKAAYILQSVLDPTVSVTETLKIMTTQLNEMSAVTRRMHEKCRPDFFYNVLRPYLGGSENSSELPNGLIYEGVNNNDDEDNKAFKLAGGSAAESSVFPVIDAVLNVEHNDLYFEKIKQYMPKEHREFIDHIKKNINMQDVVTELNDQTVINLYNESVEALKGFRRAHFSLVNDYILVFTRQEAVDSDEVRGSGGTELKKFLTTSMKETNDTLLESCTERLYNILDELQIKYTVLNHNKITTMEEGKEIAKQLKGTVPVNILVKSKKGDLYLIVKSPNSKIELKDVAKVVNTKSLTVVKPEVMTSVLGVPKGCVTVFGLINDKKKQVTVLIDKNIPRDEPINFHPLRNDATLTLDFDNNSNTGLVMFLDWTGNKCMLF